jgi:AcrR family transcriptional regulator
MATIAPHDARLEQLLTAAAEVFARKGFHPTTMRDLARVTGMSLAGMYHYVAGKEELLHRIQRRCFERVLDGASRALAPLADPEERLRAFIRHHVTFFASHMAEMKVLSHEAESLSGPPHEEILALKRRYVALLERLIRDLGADERDARVGAYALFGMMNWIYTWYRPDGPVPADDLAARFAELFLRGLPAASASLSEGG